MSIIDTDRGDGAFGQGVMVRVGVDRSDVGADPFGQAVFGIHHTVFTKGRKAQNAGDGSDRSQRAIELA